MIFLSIPYKNYYFCDNNGHIWRECRELKGIINKDLIYLINNLLIAAGLRENIKLIFKFNKYF